MSAISARSERNTTTLAAAVAVLVAGVTVVLWFGHLEANVSRLQSDAVGMTSHFDRIDDGRTIELQRLAKTEEAVSRINATLDRMDEKLDRALRR